MNYNCSSPTIKDSLIPFWDSNNKNIILDGDWINYYIRYAGYPFWQYWIDNQDPRTAGWTLVDTNPYTILAIMFSYSYICTKLGPSIMKDRKPFDLKRIMLVYNIMMALTNATFVLLISFWFRCKFTNFRYPDLNDRSTQSIWEINVAWWYYMTKFIDLIDTLFLVLRKKHETHITFLHMYHHASVPIFTYVFIKHNALMPGGHLFALMNGTIHTLMYSYYALATFGPNIRKYLWWKPYITMAQMSQFIVLTIYSLVLIINQEGYPRFWLYFCLPQFYLFYKMFYDFYQKAYLRNSCTKKLSSNISPNIDKNNNEKINKKHL